MNRYFIHRTDSQVLTLLLYNMNRYQIGPLAKPYNLDREELTQEENETQ